MTRAELEAEAARRIDALGLAPDKRDLLHGAPVYGPDGRQIPADAVPQRVREDLQEWADQYNCHVYLICANPTAYGMLWTALYVAAEREEWDEDSELLREGLHYAQVINADFPDLSEAGLIEFEASRNRFVRVG